MPTYARPFPAFAAQVETRERSESFSFASVGWVRSPAGFTTATESSSW